MCPCVHGSPRSPEADIRHSGAGVIDCIEKQIWLLRTKIRFSRGAANIFNDDSLLFLIYSIQFAFIYKVEIITLIAVAIIKLSLQPSTA